MHINPSELKEFVENNPKLVTRKESKRHPGLFVLKYSRNVFYDNLWHLNPLLMWCRGLVVDKDYNVVVLPFKKVFNYGENGTKIDLDEPCTVVRKVNGFLGIVTINGSEVIYSTTGSLDSDFVDLIEKNVQPMLKNIAYTGCDKLTLFFEICDESDPHIIAEEFGAYLIGGHIYDSRGVYKTSYSENALNEIASWIGAKRFNSFQVKTFQEVVDMTNACEHEGFMVIGHKSGIVLKIKSPYYLITKFLGRASDVKILEMAESKSARQRVDEEYYPLLGEIARRQDEFLSLDEQGRIEFIRDFLKEANNV